MKKFLICNYTDLPDIQIFDLIIKVTANGKLSEDMTLYSYATVFTLKSGIKILVATEKLNKSKKENKTIKFIIQKY
jgi:hypothetical protein